MNLKNIWNLTVAALHSDDLSSQREWQKLHNLYSEKGRFYHNLSHLEFMFSHLKAVKHLLADKDAVWLAVFYHDAVYNTKAQDNEEQSAQLAETFLNKESAALASKVSALILSTKKHISLHDDPDFQFFLDTDLLILGMSWKEYALYAQNIRKEYLWANEEEYHNGRARVLQAFLQRPRIFLTDEFYEKYEKQARLNITRELSQ